MSKHRIPLGRVLLLPLVLAAAVACEDDPTERMLGVFGSGSASVFVFIDRDDNGTFNFGTDTRLTQRPVVLKRLNAPSDSFLTQTDTAGRALFARIGVGRYVLTVPTAILGDSLEQFSGGASFTIPNNDTVSFTAGLRFRSATVAEARALPVGSRVWIKGIVLNGWSTFGDSTVHIERGGVAIRLSRLPATGVVPGDTARFFGTRAVRDGQPTYNIQSVVPETRTDAPPPVDISTATAANAGGGAWDAALVRVVNVAVTDTSRTAFGDRLLAVDDGSGGVVVQLTRTLNFDPPSVYAPGMRLDVTGLLVPDPAVVGRWIIKPRGRFDLVVR